MKQNNKVPSPEPPSRTHTVSEKPPPRFYNPLWNLMQSAFVSLLFTAHDWRHPTAQKSLYLRMSEVLLPVIKKIPPADNNGTCWRKYWKLPADLAEWPSADRFWRDNGTRKKAVQSLHYTMQADGKPSQVEIWTSTKEWRTSHVVNTWESVKGFLPLNFFIIGMIS